MINKVVARSDANQNPFAPKTDRPGTTVSEQFEEAAVIDVIVNNDHTEYSKDGYNVGAIKFRFLNSNYYRPDETLSWAFPLDSNISEYPLLNELVYVFRALNRFYYMRKFNVANRPTSQPFFGVNEEAQPVPSSNENLRNMRSSSASPIKQKTASPKLGKYFRDDETISRLKHLEGDLVIEGRSGQSIRFGTSWKDGVTGDVLRKPFKSTKLDQSPNLLIRIGPDREAKKTTSTPYGLVVEDINKDASSLWMVSDQIVPLRFSTQDSEIHRASAKDLPASLDGNQIVANSGRIVLNAKTDKIWATSALGIHWTTLRDITIDSDGNHISWTTKNRNDRVGQTWKQTIGSDLDVSVSKGHSLVVGKNSFISAQNNIQFVGQKILIGSSSTDEPLVLGATLRSFLDQLIQILVQEPIVAITGAPGGPSPQNPARIVKLLQLKAQFLSGDTKARILSLDNFTTRNNANPANPRTIRNYKED